MKPCLEISIKSEQANKEVVRGRSRRTAKDNAHGASNGDLSEVVGEAEETGGEERASSASER